jgi:hypothetical protein
MDAFGWQGGTIHQLAEETGLDIFQILDIDKSEPSSKRIDSDYSRGRFAFNTCSVEFNLKNNYPKKKGNLDFWSGVFSASLEKNKDNQRFIID